ncbi:M3 family oligoendopeptidase [Clostridium mediterraneense]|uniref:M3 family oligoendopeptidase n=1 Tax=Clostridium mediterraneense TaxID=1805472 RepID=UPI0008356B8E|nr:M3 family oligoendopeptidase [Clostridium mediterraneense]
MDGKWSLKELYSGFDSKEYKEDLKKLEIKINNFSNFAKSLIDSQDDVVKALEEHINYLNEFKELSNRLLMYTNLIVSVDTKNTIALKNIGIIETLLSKTADTDAKLCKWIVGIEDLDNIIEKSELLKEHRFYFSEVTEMSKYVLSDKEELIIAKMRNTGSAAWSKLTDLETSSLLVDIELDGEKKQLPLSMVRNLAFDSDANVRKTAYEAEIKSYKKIENSVAASLSGIKGEVITVCDMKGYKSPLAETLLYSRMSEKSLNVMIEAMKESLPAFEKYHKRKAEILGHKNGLPFYDLFAPLKGGDKTYSFEEAKQFILDNFATFSDKLSAFAKRAFDNNWVDVYPREGKVGGAFCENLHMIGESRIMLNFGGNLTDIITLAHELGHGYHGDCLMQESAINADYPMPIAETASTFCETIVKKAAIKNGTKLEAFSIIEAELSDCAQIIVDILSRFLFESEVFEKRKEGALSADELKEIMINAQKATYGEGLDSNYMHPYMWACKPHYYYASENFYNFPYAFGLLFAKGLYAEYLKRGNEFVKAYDELLSVTGKNKLIDVTKLMNIDIESKEFWKNSLKTIEEDIEKFIEISKEIYK